MEWKYENIWNSPLVMLVHNSPRESFKINIAVLLLTQKQTETLPAETFTL